MTNKELKQRVKELEQERDLWRDMVSRFVKALPGTPVVLPPCVTPQTWPPFIMPTIAPPMPIMPTITCGN